MEFHVLLKFLTASQSVFIVAMKTKVLEVKSVRPLVLVLRRKQARKNLAFAIIRLQGSIKSDIEEKVVEWKNKAVKCLKTQNLGYIRQGSLWPFLTLLCMRTVSLAFSFPGGFDGTSNVLAGKLFNIPVKGTHAHAYVTSFSGAEDLTNAEIKHKTSDYVEKNFYDKCIEWRTKLAAHLKIMRDEAHDGELAAFASYAVAFPDGFLALVDTYDVSRYYF